MNKTDEQLLKDYESASNSSQRKELSSSSQRKDLSSRSQNERGPPSTSKLASHSNHCLQGFNATNAISFRRSSDKLTFSRPGNMTNYWLEDKEDQFFPDNKAFWPVLSDRDMRRPFPIKVTMRPHRIPDPDYVVPLPNKKVKQPEPVLPKGNKDGVKLRDPDDILRDLQAKKLKTGPSNVPPPPRVESVPKQPLDIMPDSIRGVLQSIADSRLLQERNSKNSSQVNKVRNPGSVNSSSSSSVRTPTRVTNPKPVMAHSSTPSSSTPARPPKKKLSSISEPEELVDVPEAKEQPRVPETRKQPRSSDKDTSLAKSSQKKPIHVNIQDHTRSPAASTVHKKPAEESTTPNVHQHASDKPAPFEDTINNEENDFIDFIEASKYLFKEQDEVEIRDLSILITPPYVESCNKPKLNVIIENPEAGLIEFAEAKKLAPRHKSISKGKAVGQRQVSIKSDKSKILAEVSPKSRPFQEKKSREAMAKQLPTSNKKLSTKKQEDTTSSSKYKEKASINSPNIVTSTAFKSNRSSKPSPVATDLPKPARSSKPKIDTRISEEADLEEGETRSPSPNRNKKQKTRNAPASSAAALIEQPEASSAPRRPKSPLRPRQTKTSDSVSESAFIPHTESRRRERSPKPSSVAADPPKHVRGSKRTIDTRASDEADLEEGETRSPSPSRTKKQKTRNSPASSAAAPIEQPEASSVPRRPRSPRRTRSPPRPRQTKTSDSISESVSVPHTESKGKERSFKLSPAASSSPNRRRDSPVERRSRSPTRRSSRRESSVEQNQSPLRQVSSVRRVSKVAPWSMPVSASLPRTHVVASILTTDTPSASKTPIDNTNNVNSEPIASSSTSHLNASSLSSKVTASSSSSGVTASSSPSEVAALSSSSRVTAPSSSSKVAASSSTSDLNASSSSSKVAAPSTSSNVNASSSSSEVTAPSSSSSKIAASSSTSRVTTSSSQAGGNRSTATLNAEEFEKYKIFQIMSSKLATKTKHRGDSRIQTKAGVLDHFHALCSYIISFYYADKIGRGSIRDSIVTWKSLFPFCENLLRNLDICGMSELRPLVHRLMGLIRFYLFGRFRLSLPTRPSLSDDHAVRAYLEFAGSSFREHLKAIDYYRMTETQMSYRGILAAFPDTFEDVCVRGDLSRGIVLDGEAGSDIKPMTPFEPYSELNHSAIVARCLLSEYVEKNNIAFVPITKPEEFM